MATHIFLAIRDQCKTDLNCSIRDANNTFDGISIAPIIAKGNIIEGIEARY